MKVYKEKQFLIFDFEDGKTVKYNFATKESIGKKGAVVKNICSQLRGMTMEDLENACTDVNYTKFLQFVRHNERSRGSHISNIGSILDAIPRYSLYEQFFSAGIVDIDRYDLHYSINDIPKGLLKIAASGEVRLSDKLINIYKKYPNEVSSVLSKNYMSLTRREIIQWLGYTYWDARNYESKNEVMKLVNDYHYSFTRLFDYLDEIKTYEALDNPYRLLKDYADMMAELGTKFDKYPRHLHTTHDIATRNYRRLKDSFDELAFKKRINKNMEYRYGDYVFMYPNSTQEIKDEAIMQNNCVASYIQRVINGGCDILFMRRADEKDKSLVTIEVRDGKIVQARQHYNYAVTQDQQNAINHWDSWWANKQKEVEEVA